MKRGGGRGERVREGREVMKMGEKNVSKVGKLWMEEMEVVEGIGEWKGLGVVGGLEVGKGRGVEKLGRKGEMGRSLGI